MSCLHLKFFLGLTTSDQYSHVNFNTAFLFVTSRYFLFKSLATNVQSIFEDYLSRSLFQETLLEFSLQSLLAWALCRWNFLRIWLSKAVLTKYILLGWKRLISQERQILSIRCTWHWIHEDLAWGESKRIFARELPNSQSS